MKGVQRGKSIGALILFLGMLSWTAFSSAQEVVPVRLFEAEGTMRYVDLPGRFVQIDNKRYRLSPNMKWYGVDPEVSLVKQVLQAVNGRVAYVIDSNPKAPAVKAVWILPAEGR